MKGYFIGASLKAGRQGTGSHATQHPSLFYSRFQLFSQKRFNKLFPRQKSFIILFLRYFSLQILSILTDVFCHKRLVK